MNIFQRINAVREDVEYIRKDAVVQGYAAVTHDMVTAKLRDALIKHGIVIIPSSTIREALEGKTANGKPKIMYRATYEVSFINIDEPADKAVMFVDAHADDSGDKAPGKALSIATKYAMLKMFNLETGESDESRVEDDRRGFTEQQKISFDEIVQVNDALGLYLLTQEVDESTYTGLFNSGEKGKKTELKNTCREMQSTGQAMEANLIAALESSDTALAEENTQGLSYVGKVLLRRHLGREGQDNLDQLLKIDYQI